MAKCVAQTAPRTYLTEEGIVLKQKVNTDEDIITSEHAIILVVLKPTRHDQQLENYPWQWH